MAKTRLIRVDLDDQTLGYLKGKRDQVVAATRTLELASQNVAWALKDFHSDYQQIIGNVTKMSEDEIARLQELSPDSLPHLSSIMTQFNESHQQQQTKPKRARRDPNMPKKPMTVFLAFSTDQRAVIRAERKAKGLSALASSQMAAEVTQMWADLPEERKDQYRQQYLERLAEYRTNKAAYLYNTTGVPMEKIALIKAKPEPEAEAGTESSSEEEEDEFADALENPEDLEENDKKEEEEKEDDEEDEEDEEEVKEPPKKKRAKKSN